MRMKIGCLMIACLMLAGCDQKATTPKKQLTTKSQTTDGTKAQSNGSAADPLPTDGDAKASAAGDTATTANKDLPGPSLGASPVRAAVDSGVAKLTPENTKIIFVGTHVGPKPDPRTGGFEKFTGEAVVDEENKILKSVSVEIDTGSLWTQFPKLTEHLNSPDFFETREHPKAKFVSKSIEPGRDEGSYNITGELTLLGTTKEIKVPATAAVDDRGLTLKADFKIDRTEFGMDRLQQNVEKEVALTVVVGEKTEPLPPAG
jgi:polyisoprenoid-binding protein YceI